MKTIFNSNIMKALTNMFLSLVMIVFLSSCQTDREKQNDEANLLKIRNKIIEDSIKKIHLDSIKKVCQDSINNFKEKIWLTTTAGKIQLKHPDWGAQACIWVSKNYIWIGMTLDMLKYERGRPNRATPSNYGNGIEWQWCWNDYNPSCFYGKDDGIITSYN